MHPSERWAHNLQAVVTDPTETLGTKQHTTGLQMWMPFAVFALEPSEHG